jgi:hypothetical protein
VSFSDFVRGTNEDKQRLAAKHEIEDNSVCFHDEGVCGA